MALEALSSVVSDLMVDVDGCASVELRDQFWLSDDYISGVSAMCLEVIVSVVVSVRVNRETFHSSLNLKKSCNLRYGFLYLQHWHRCRMPWSEW